RIATVEEIAGFLTHRAEELDERERRILELHYGIGQGETYSTAEIGRLLKLSAGRVYESSIADAVSRFKRGPCGDCGRIIQGAGQRFPKLLDLPIAKGSHPAAAHNGA